MRDLTRADITGIVDLAEKIESKAITINLSGYLAALLFFEPSTRTAFSFDTAIKSLGGNSLMMQSPENSSQQKGESFADTVRTISQYANLIVMRSAVEGAARYASELVDIPVINAGDGANQHPTQALLDIYSIKKTQGRIDSLKIALVGDLKYGRTIYSLVYGLAHFKPELYLVSPQHLQIRKYVRDDLVSLGVNFHETSEISSVLGDADVMYVTRIQRERFSGQYEYEQVKDSYQITARMIEQAAIKSNFRIMHPLPRVNEITTDVDALPCAYYFQQAKNGVYIRQALIARLLGVA